MYPTNQHSKHQKAKHCRKRSAKTGDNAGSEEFLMVLRENGEKPSLKWWEKVVS